MSYRSFVLHPHLMPDIGITSLLGNIGYIYINSFKRLLRNYVLHVFTRRGRPTCPTCPTLMSYISNEGVIWLSGTLSGARQLST